MTTRVFRVALLTTFAYSCAGATTPAPSPTAPRAVNVANAAPAALVLHFDGQAQLDVSTEEPGVPAGFSGSVDVGFERVGCCNLGFYAGATRLGGDRTKALRADEVLHGGVEGGIVIPVLQNRFRLRMRFGTAGTPPEPPFLGRSGFTLSPVVVFRIWDTDSVETSEFRPDFDVVAGYSLVSLHQEDSSAGPVDEVKHARFQSHSVVLGVRIGTDFGIDLE